MLFFPTTTPWSRWEESHFLDKETGSPEKWNHLPPFTWLVRAFLHRTVWLISPWFSHYATRLFNPLSRGVFWAKAFRRRTNLSGGRVSNSAQSLEIIKRRAVLSPAGWNIVSCRTQNTEVIVIIAGSSLCQENILEIIIFIPGFSLIPTWYCNSNEAVQCSLPQGWILIPKEQRKRNVWERWHHGGWMVGSHHCDPD